MLNIYKVEKRKIRVSYVWSKLKRQKVDIFIGIPERKFLLNKGRIDEKKWLDQGVLSHRSYYGGGISLAFVNLRIADLRGRGGNEREEFYRIFQWYEQALVKRIAEIKMTQRGTLINQLCLDILETHKSIKEAKAQKGLGENEYFHYLDNLISWLTYERLIKLVVFIRKGRQSGSTKNDQVIAGLIDIQREYRKACGYSIPTNERQYEQLMSYMACLKSELGANEMLHENVKGLGRFSSKVVIGISSAAAMLGVYGLLYYTREQATEITFPLVMAIALIYGFRDIFKEGIKKRLSAFFYRYCFQWQRQIKDTCSQRQVMSQKFSALWHSKDILSKHNITGKWDRHQNYQFLHYSCQSHLRYKKLPSGFDGIHESMTLDLPMVANHLFTGKKKSYLIKSGGRIRSNLKMYEKIYVMVVFRGKKTTRKFIEVTLSSERIISLNELTRFKNEKRVPNIASHEGLSI